MEEIFRTIKDCYNKLEMIRNKIENYELHPYTLQLYEFILQDLVELYTNIKDDMEFEGQGDL